MTVFRFSVLFIVLLGLAGLETGCTRVDSSSHADNSTTSYDVRGRVVQVDSEGHTLLVEHEPIPGHMPAMTMEFSAKQGDDVRDLTPGTAIQFRCVVDETETWIEQVEPLADDALPKHPATEDAPTRTAPTNRSLYQLEMDWTTQSGQRVDLATFQGQPVVLAMIFTHCSYACPLIVRDMKTITSSLPPDMNDGVQRVLVSIDPARDTPEALTRFAEAHRLSPDRWTLLRSTPDDVRTLAAVIGVRYKPEADGQFAHTNLITLLNTRGEIVHQQEGLGKSVTASAEALRAALAPPS